RRRLSVLCVAGQNIIAERGDLSLVQRIEADIVSRNDRVGYEHSRIAVGLDGRVRAVYPDAVEMDDVRRLIDRGRHPAVVAEQSTVGDLDLDRRAGRDVDRNARRTEEA